MTRIFMLILLILPSLTIAKSNDLTIGQSIKIESKILNETRTIQVHLPRNYESDNKKYPVLYLTDGPYNFKHTVGSVDFLAENGRTPHMIVVGIGNTDRARDLTPSVLSSKKDKEVFKTAGGADNFLKFFEQELIPYIERNYRTQPYRIFSGHSFGGLFAIHAFLTKPELFNAYIAVSPSLWWDDQRLISLAKDKFSTTDFNGRTLFVTMADEGENMITPYENFLNAAKQSQVKGLTLINKEFDDEDHGSTGLRSQYFGLKHIWNDWHLPFETMKEGLATVISHYQHISKRFGFEVPVTEALINNVGYYALSEKDYEGAIEAFTYNVKHFPESANVYDSLADAYEAKGELNLALENYTKAVELAKDEDRNKAVFTKNKARIEKRLTEETQTTSE
ncbi:alpha/beta hydrolase-fold protein [Thalassotalea ganghwensis]